MKIFFSTFAILFSVIVFGQSTGGSPNYGPNKYLGYNGTSGPNPLLFKTNATTRMQLNGSLSYGVDGLPAQAKSGYLLIGNDIPLNNDLFSNGFGAFSMLHLAGRDGQFVQEFGYRNWMKTGVTFTDNTDLSYIGLRQVGTGYDKTETTITWADNASGAQGPDDMVFRFTGWNNPNTNSASSINSTNLMTTDDEDGLHIARFTGDGYMALGNTFGINGVNTPPNLYVRPSSLLHMSHTYIPGQNQWGFMQVTYRGLTGETANDGLRLGIDQGGTTNGYLRWQENTPFIVQTDWNANAGGIQQGERMRVTSVNSPGVPQPATIVAGGNMTRVAISHRGDQPITEPRSLLHLGYNTGTSLLPGLIVDGWRDWMDVGTFTNIGSDNMYVGMKEEGTDRYDAVVSWGDNQVSGATPNGPDNLRFIFTSTTTALTGQGDPVSQSNDGLEVARMEPDVASTMSTTNYGMMGVGNFSPTGPNTGPADVVDAKLDIDGDLRIRTVTEDSTLNQILVIDSTDHNRVHWRSIESFIGTDDQNLIQPTIDCNTGILNLGIEGGNNVQVDLSCLSGGSISDIHNGLSTSTTIPGYHALGQNLIGGSGAELLNDREIPMNDWNIVFTNNGSANGNKNRIGVGTSTPNAKFHVNLDANLSSPVPTAVSITNSAVGTANNSIGQKTRVDGQNLVNVGGITEVNNAEYGMGQNIVVESGLDSRGLNSHARYGSSNNIGIQGIGSSTLTYPGVTNIGVVGNGNNASYNIGGQFVAVNTPGSNPGINNNGVLASASGAETNIAVRAQASGGTNAYGVYADAGGATTTNYAGYFNGPVYVNGTITSSDENLKTNINAMTNGLDIIHQLEPKTFEYDQVGYPSMNLASGMQYGLIAQDVEMILPEIVSDNTHPAKYDTLGTLIYPEVTFKGLNYEQFIPILIKGMQEQQEQIDSLQTANNQSNNYGDSLEQVVSSLNDRLTQLENCLSNILPALCQANQMMIESTPDEVQETLRHTLDVELSNGNNIVLNQNVPNPFAEKTVITYSIPQTVGKAQIHFYDGTGKLINSVEINERGNGQLNVYASDLSMGVYTYSLVADGQIISTKRMVKQ